MKKIDITAQINKEVKRQAEGTVSYKGKPRMISGSDIDLPSLKTKVWVNCKNILFVVFSIYHFFGNSISTSQQVINARDSLILYSNRIVISLPISITIGWWGVAEGRQSRSRCSAMGRDA